MSLAAHLLPSAGRTSAADTHDWDRTTSDPVPVEYDSTRTTHASHPRRSERRQASSTPGAGTDHLPVRSTHTWNGG